jgi:hypothetical protein
LTTGDGLALGTRTMPQRILGEMPLSWIPVFEVMITMDLITAVLDQLVLKPVRRRWIEQTNQVDSA